MLHGRRVELIADGIDETFACSTVVAKHAYLDQFVAFENGVDFA